MTRQEKITKIGKSRVHLGTSWMLNQTAEPKYLGWLLKYLIISNNYFTMNGFTKKDAILVIFFANILIYKNSRSVFPLKIVYLVQKNIFFLSQVKILAVFHQLQKEWILCYLKWAWNECLLLKTSGMSIDMGSSIVHCVCEGRCQKRFSGFCPLRGGGDTPPLR